MAETIRVQNCGKEIHHTSLSQNKMINIKIQKHDIINALATIHITQLLSCNFYLRQFFFGESLFKAILK